MQRKCAAIATERLLLVPFTAEFLRALLAGNRELAATLLAADIPAGWAGLPDVFRLRLTQLESDPALQPWLLRGMVLQSNRRLIGHIGFHTAPDAAYLAQLAPGGIELGYTVFPPFRRQGFATEAALALMNWARDLHGISRFVLSIRPDNHPSLGLAAKLRFHRIGEHLDEVDGLEHIFLLER